MEMLRNFCSNTTVHGVRYFTEPRLHWTERIWWVLAFCLSIVLCTFVILAIWLDWHDRPVTVSFNEKLTSIATIPFPAVTICTSQTFTTDEIDTTNIEDSLGSYIVGSKNLSSELLDKLDVIQQICLKWHIRFPTNHTFQRSESIYDTIRGLASRSFMEYAQFYNLFTYTYPIFTEDGLCYTFNSLNSRDIFTNIVAPEVQTVNHQYNTTHWHSTTVDDLNRSEVYPYRAFSTKYRDSLQLDLIQQIEYTNVKCEGPSRGFHLSFHLPNEVPLLSEEKTRVPIAHESFILIKPIVITTSNGLRTYSPSARGCFFETERQLQFFKQYNQHNCELECLANHTQSECECVPFYLPRESATRVCTMVDFDCMIKSDNSFAEKLVINNCNCLADCTSITYDVSVSQSETDSYRNIKVPGHYIGTNRLGALSRISISFKHSQYIGLTRTETSTMFDFIASCGGLLGLFMGVSMISLIEFIYFFTLRLFCKARRPSESKKKRNIWKRNKIGAMNKRCKRTRF